MESYLTKVGIDMGIDEKNIYNVTVQNGQAIIIMQMIIHLLRQLQILGQQQTI